MIHINKGEPWLFRPSYICDSLPENPANKYLNGQYNFSFEIEMLYEEIKKEREVIFAILPDYTGIDIYDDKLILTFDFSGNREYFELRNTLTIGNINKIKFKHIPKEYIAIIINDIVVFSKRITNLFFGNNSKDPHIIFGAGNFPINNFNLNYAEYELHLFKMYLNDEIISHHNFKKIIHGKSFDLTDNCNFINKI